MRLTILLFILTLSLPVYAASDVDDLMDKAEKGLAKTPILEATFAQKTSMPFMDVDLNSSGKFCFSIEDRKNPSIYWEYREPDVSGFIYENGHARLWTAKSGHTLSSQEMKLLGGMTDQILQWISFDPENLKKIYDVSHGDAQNSLLFIPREESHLFKGIQLTFSDNFDRLTQLRFLGQNGEKTDITFHIDSMNQPLSKDCRK